MWAIKIPLFYTYSIRKPVVFINEINGSKQQEVYWFSVPHICFKFTFKNLCIAICTCACMYIHMKLCTYEIVIIMALIYSNGFILKTLVK